MEQVITVIERVLEETNSVDSIRPVGIDDAISEMTGLPYIGLPQLHLIVEDFFAGQRLCVNQLEQLPALERQTRALGIFTDQQIDSIFRPLSDMMGAELNFLFSGAQHSHAIRSVMLERGVPRVLREG